MKEGLTVTSRLFMPALLAVLAMATPALAEDYQTNLGPMPLDDETKEFIAGRGDVTASFQGDTLTVQGSFRGLPSNATEAYIWQSAHTGVPGKQVQSLNLTVTQAQEGNLSGSFKLTRAQSQALREGNLYIQISSEKAPPGYMWGPRGTLWGWLFPAHETVGPNVPQQGNWFIPKLHTLSR